MSSQSDITSVQSMAEASKTIQQEISKAIIGQHDIIEQLLISCFHADIVFWLVYRGLQKHCSFEHCPNH